MIKDLYKKNLNESDLEELNNICEECNKNDESVSQNFILRGFKLCNSCQASKNIFPV